MATEFSHLVKHDLTPILGKQAAAFGVFSPASEATPAPVSESAALASSSYFSGSSSSRSRSRSAGPARSACLRERPACLRVAAEAGPRCSPCFLGAGPGACIRTSRQAPALAACRGLRVRACCGYPLRHLGAPAPARSCARAPPADCGLRLGDGSPRRHLGAARIVAGSGTPGLLSVPRCRIWAPPALPRSLRLSWGPGLPGWFRRFPASARPGPSSLAAAPSTAPVNACSLPSLLRRVADNSKQTLFVVCPQVCRDGPGLSFSPRRRLVQPPRLVVFASRPFLTCRSLGCCCCTARRRGPTMHFVSYPQNSPIFLPLSTTLQCRDVSGHGQSAVPTCLLP